MYDEAKAIEELSAMSREARDHLGHVIRNAMQTIAGAVEMDQADHVPAYIERLNTELRRMGI